MSRKAENPKGMDGVWMGCQNLLIHRVKAMMRPLRAAVPAMRIGGLVMTGEPFNGTSLMDLLSRFISI